MKKLKIFGAVLILVGVFIISYAIGARLWTENQQNKMVNSYEQEIQNAKRKKKQATNEVASNETTNKVINGTVGILTIPKIDLKVGIGEGTDMDTLKYAVGHFTNTAMPGEKGNFCLAGHRSYTYGEYFNRLGEINVGDEIDVKTVNGSYKYKVYKTEVVLPSDVSVLNSSSDATMTLITCTPIRIATHRLIIKAKLQF